jgi:hypothetical protein
MLKVAVPVIATGGIMSPCKKLKLNLVPDVDVTITVCPSKKSNGADIFVRVTSSPGLSCAFIVA